MKSLYGQIESLSIDEFEQLLKFIEQNSRERIRLVLAETDKKVARLTLGLSSVKTGGKSVGKPRNQKKNKQTAKYRNPHDATQTWTGMGRKPEWFKAYLENGGVEADLLI